MEKIPTATEYIEQHPYVCSFLSSAQGFDTLKTFMIDFAKLHHEAQQKAILEKIKLTDFACEFLQEGASDAIDKDSILNSYPLENIK